MRVAFDIETNGFLDVLDVVHSLVITDVDTEQTWSCADQPGYTPISKGLEILQAADQVIGHNIIKFDIPALQKVYPSFSVPEHKVFDTLIASRLIWTNRKELDLRRKGFPGKLIGRHSLEAWGHRLGCFKGDYAKLMEEQGLDPWSTWNKEMQDYCVNDVEVTMGLIQLIDKCSYSARALDLEHRFFRVIMKQEEVGYRFDEKSAVELYTELLTRRDSLLDTLTSAFTPVMVRNGFRTKVPKRNNSRYGYIEGAEFCPVKVEEFNPGSRAQIAKRLQAQYGWEPKEFTDTGQPKVDETTLGGLDYPEVELLREFLLIEKRLGQLGEGKNAWLKLVKDGRIHGAVNTNGAVTGRCTHNKPNMAQIPSTSAPYGKTMRGLFVPDPGFKQLGCDASGLELRCLAHFTHPFDGGAYAKTILEGKKEDGTDIHTMNQKAAGLPTRDIAKTFIYAFIYGAGDELLGDTYGITPELIMETRTKSPKRWDSILKRLRARGKPHTPHNVCAVIVGERLRKQFLAKTPALAMLQDAVQEKVKKDNHLRGIDGRILNVRSPHSALNTLLQSAGAVLVKQATVNLYESLTEAGYMWGKDWAMLAHVHDEFQLQVREEIVQDVVPFAIESFRKAGRQFDWRCPLDGEAQVGNSWAECH